MQRLCCRILEGLGVVLRFRTVAKIFSIAMEYTLGAEMVGEPISRFTSTTVGRVVNTRRPPLGTVMGLRLRVHEDLSAVLPASVVQSAATACCCSRDAPESPSRSVNHSSRRRL